MYTLLLKQGCTGSFLTGRNLVMEMLTLAVYVGPLQNLLAFKVILLVDPRFFFIACFAIIPRIWFYFFVPCITRVSFCSGVFHTNIGILVKVVTRTLRGLLRCSWSTHLVARVFYFPRYWVWDFHLIDTKCGRLKYSLFMFNLYFDDHHLFHR